MHGSLWLVITDPGRLVFQVACSDDGLEAIVFTAQGDMRQVSVATIVARRIPLIVNEVLNEAMYGMH